MPAAPRVTIDADGLIPLLKGLGKVEKGLRDHSNGRLRDAAQTASTQLVSDLKTAAAGSQTPQARLVAESIRVRRDRLVSVAIGGGLKVGRYGAPAGALLYGSEGGGVNFSAPPGGSYWIAPTVDRFRSGPAQQTYLRAVGSILRDAGL